LEVPSELPYLRTIRLTTASLLTGWDLDVELVEDLRVAVTEACTVLWKHHDRRGPTRVAYRLDARSVRVELQLRSGSGDAGAVHGPRSEAAVSDALGESLIEHLTDRHRYDAAQRRFVLETDL
jgi:anti-sigma regulatory factor (Ser/Thr protein kinase)